MNDERRELALKLRVGVFVLVALAVFLGMVYALGARARLFEARYTVHADFGEVGGLTEGATVRLAGVQIGRVTGVHLPGAPGGKVRVDLNIAKRFADRVRRDSIARIETQGLLGDKIVEITVGTAAAAALQPSEVLAAREPTDVARVISEGADAARNVAALVVALRQTVDSVNRTLLVDPKYRATLDDLRAVAHNLRGVSDRLAGGRGTLGALLAEGDEGAVRAAGEDLRGAVANLKAVSGRLEAGEGTLGGLLADPTIYERLVAILEGAQRSFLLRSLIRGLGREPAPETTGDAPKR